MPNLEWLYFICVSYRVCNMHFQNGCIHGIPHKKDITCPHSCIQQHRTPGIEHKCVRYLINGRLNYEANYVSVLALPES